MSRSIDRLLVVSNNTACCSSVYLMLTDIRLAVTL
jgi:hypothetical protein